MTTPTPRTDAAAIPFHAIKLPYHPSGLPDYTTRWVPRDKMAELEQELNEARQQQEAKVTPALVMDYAKVQAERDKLRKVVDELADFIKSVVSEHHASMQEARDIGYSDGMFLKPSFAIMATNCERTYSQLPHVQERKTK